MFRTLLQKMSAWAETVDILGSDLAEPGPEPDLHPHRVPVRLELTRRAGSVSARPAVCVSPVRPAPDRSRQRAARP
jgi:hypothetical protein